MPDRRDQPRASENQFDSDELVAIAAVAAVLALVAWLLPALATLSHSQRLPPVGAVESIVGTGRVVADGPMSDPRRAYPAAARRAMPQGGSWWLAALGPLALVATAGLLAWRRMEPARARALLGRRGYDPRGSEPREWARPRDLSALVVSRRIAGRFTLGRLDRRLLVAEAETHVAVVAPTRSGKTTRCVIPWLLEHDGPALVTSTKRDVFDATAAHRRRLGDVWVWDPGSGDCTCWTPLEGCQDWGWAHRSGLWFAEAVGGSDDHAAARFWNEQAARLLGPLLHAAALAARDLDEVLAWLDGQEVDEPAAILAAAGAGPAARQLTAVAGLDPRNRGTLYVSAGALVGAYRDPDVLTTARPGLTARRFLDGGAHTLYVCAPARRARELAPLVVTMLSGILEHAAVTAARQGPLEPALRVLLDEAANIAPLGELPSHLSQAGGHGVRIASVWQDLAQLRARYGDAADSILANSAAKLFMGPVTDDQTRGYVDGLLGQERDEDSSWRPKGSAQALQQLSRDRALVVSGSLPPAVVKLSPYWKDRTLARRATAAAEEAR